MYKFKENLNNNNYFRFDKALVREKKWARLPLASKSIFPVIGVHCNAHGKAWPSQETIGSLAGCTAKTVREGINGLKGLPGFKIDRYVTSRGHKGIKYYITLPPMDEKGRCFSFNKNIIEGGNWRQSKQSAQALYPVMRTFSFWDYEYCIDEEDIDDTDFSYEYKTRKFDLVNADIDLLADYSGIGLSTAYEAIKVLEDNFLIEETIPHEDLQTWKVFVVPPRIWKREFLNNNIKENEKAFPDYTY